MNKKITYSNYYKFKAKIIAVPSSYNRVGIDVYPKYFVRPTELLEVMSYSKSVKSVDSGFQKDKESGLYLKHKEGLNETITEEELRSQFLYFSIKPPYWFHDEDTYAEFVKSNMDENQSALLESKYITNKNPKIQVPAETDDDIHVEHFYTEITDWTIREFNKNKVVQWPKEKGVIISKINL